MDRIKYGLAFGPKHGSQLMGRPTRVLKILWAYSWAGPLMSAKSHGPLVGPAHLIFMGHFWAMPRVDLS